MIAIGNTRVVFVLSCVRVFVIFFRPALACVAAWAPHSVTDTSDI